MAGALGCLGLASGLTGHTGLAAAVSGVDVSAASLPSQLAASQSGETAARSAGESREGRGAGDEQRGGERGGCASVVGTTSAGESGVLGP